MSRREDERKKSLSALFRIANQAPAQPANPPRPAPPRPAAPVRAPQLQRPVPSAPAPRPAAAKPAGRAARPLDARFEGRRAKQEEERQLRERRANELHRNKNPAWRGMDRMNVPATIRRTGFDREEPTLGAKVDDILGAPREKDGRVKNREKGRRTGGAR